MFVGIGILYTSGDEFSSRDGIVVGDRCLPATVDAIRIGGEEFDAALFPPYSVIASGGGGSSFDLGLPAVCLASAICDKGRTSEH